MRRVSLLALAGTLVAAQPVQAERSGVRPEVLSLPTGPGSIEGLGQSFDPSPYNGTASYAVPIAVPPGVAGFQPALALEYSSGAGNGELGIGWRLALPSVQRSTDQGLPRYDATDRFVARGLGGSTEDLALVVDGTYRFRIEGAFTRGRRLPDGSWEFHNPAGYRFVFGTESAAVVADGSRVFAWHLTLHEDTHGNRIVYEYERDATGRPYLIRVVYNDFGPAFVNEVLLTYEDRPDTIASYLPTFRVTTARRLKTIEVTSGGALVRRYELGYDMMAGLSRLVSVGLVGTDGQTRIPSLVFAYAAPAMSAAAVVTMTAAPARSVGSDAEIDDVDGDGLADLLITDPALDGGLYSYYPNLDGTAFAARQVLAASPSVWLTSSSGVELADMDGDGAADVVARLSTAADGFRYYPAVAGGFGAGVVVTPNPVFAPGDPDTRLIDLDHDRRTDWLRIDPTSGALTAAFHLGGGAFSAPVSLPPLATVEILSFTTGTGLRVADMNGDGLADLVSVRSGSLRYWPSRGRGAFDAVVAVAGAPALSDAELAQTQIRDVTGDGLSDLVHVGVSQVRVWSNVAGASLAATMTIAGTPELRPETTVRVADMNGNGSGDIVWIDPTDPAAPWRYLDFVGNGAPGLLTRIDNGLGAVTTVSYAGFGQLRAWARSSGVAWTRRCPVGQMVVSRIETDDGLGGVTATDLRYADAYFDGSAREFRGFAQAIQTDLGDVEQPTLVTEMAFDVGDGDETRKGLMLSRTRRADDGGIFDIATFEYEIRTIAAATDGSSVRAAFRRAEATELHEQGGVPRFTRSEWEYDDDGNVVREAHYGEVSETGEFGLGDDEVIVDRTFARNEATGVIDRVVAKTVRDLAGNRVAETRTYYDGEPLLGLPLGQVDRGDVSRVTSWISGDRFGVEDQIERDARGNVVRRYDGRAGLTHIDYGPDHTFPSSIRLWATEDRFLEWRVVYDLRFGQPVRVVEPTTAERLFLYDALGRPTAIVEPGDTPDLPTLRFEYTLGAPLSYVRTEQREQSGEQGAIVAYAYVDGLRRPRGQFEEAPGGQWAATGLTLVGRRGWTRFVEHPSLVGTADFRGASETTGGVWTSYDALGRRREEREVDGATRRWDYLPLEVHAHDENDLEPASSHYATPTIDVLDGLGRIRRVIERDGSREVEQRYDFDSRGNLVAATDPRGVVRRYEFDGRSRQVAVVEPNAGRWTFEYDDADDLIRRADAAGNRVSWTRDLLGRITEERHQASGEPSERVVVRLGYDEPAPEHSELAHVPGQLAWVQDDAGAVYFGYDSRGLLSDRIRRWHDGTEHATWTTYDARGRVMRRGFPDGTYIPHEYDERGHLRSQGGIITDATWTASGALNCLTYGNGVRDCREYDARLRLSRMVASAPSGAPMRDLAFSYDSASHIRAITDGRMDVDPSFDLSAAYAYDDRYRLRRAADQVAVTTWEYDDVGNIRRVMSGHEDPFLNAEYRYGEGGAGPDQLTSIGTERLRYDAAGRVIEDGERQLEWDAKGRLRRVVKGDVEEEYIYDFEDRRAIKTTRTGSGSEIVRYIDRDADEREGKLVRYVFVADARVVRIGPDEVDGGGCALGDTAPRDSPGIAIGSILALLVYLAKRFRRAGARLTAVAAILALGTTCGGGDAGPSHSGEPIDHWPASATLYLGNHHGTVVAVADADAAVVAEYAYHPYGALRAQRGIVLPHRFAGNERDDAVGLDDFKVRAYRSGASRFLSVDPLVLQPTSVLQATLPAYAYTTGNPIDSFDPDGRQTREDVVGGIVTACGTSSACAAAATAVGWAVVGLGAVAALTYGIANYPDWAPLGHFTDAEAEAWAERRIRLYVPDMSYRGSQAEEDLDNSTFKTEARAVKVSTKPYEDPKKVVVPQDRYPEAAKHIKDAQKKGKPSVLTVARPGTKDRRKASLKGTTPVKGKDRDEYPPAFTAEGGAGASVRPIDPSDNRGAGACIGAQCRDVPDGGKIQIEVE